MTIETTEQSNALIRQRARADVAKVFAANRGKPELEIDFALGTASAKYPTKGEKRIWLDEIRQYREELEARKGAKV